MVAVSLKNYRRHRDQGLRLRNGLRSHTVPWARVHKILLRPGDPWAMLLVKPQVGSSTTETDVEKRMLMGIQAHDGAIAVDAVNELRRRLKRAIGADDTDI